jgi:hypothetical protein
LLSARTNIDKHNALMPHWQVDCITAARLSGYAVLANLDAIGRVACTLCEDGELSGALVAALCGKPQ